MYNPSPQWVTALPAASEARQMIVTACVGHTTASISMHEKDAAGIWRQLLTTPGFIGKNGLGKEREGDHKTPRGVFRIDRAFGIQPDPGCHMPYRQVDEYDYWSGDHRPGMRYNEMVSLKDYPDLDTENSEHLISFGVCYNYCLNMGYNPDRVPGLGSALFIHSFCPTAPYTAGCIALPDAVMREVIRKIRPGCLAVTDSMEALGCVL